MKAPGKKIIIFLIVAALTAATAYFFVNSSRKETYVAPAVTSPAQSAALAKDSDNDGLKDWEEQLWKTDPYNPDTDGDGTPDGLEIKQGRNPLVAGPNDKLDTNTISNKVNTETEADLSETDKFSRDLFVRIIAAKNANTPPTENDINKFLNAAIGQETNSQKLKNFTAGDFQVDKDETPEKIKAYGNAVGAIFIKKPPSPLETEITIIDRAETNNDPAELKKLEPLVAEYKRIGNNLLKVTVPQSALLLHLALANSVAGMAWSITGMEYILTDPIRALPGISAYADNSQKLVASIRGFKSYFVAQGVVLEPGDRAYTFFNKI